MKTNSRTTSLALLALICVCAVGLRLAGVGWLADAVPHPGYSFHPDVMRFVEPIADFENIRGWRGYPVGFTSQLFVTATVLGYAGLDADPVTLIRSISLSYGVLTIFLVGLLAWRLSGSGGFGALAAAFLALAPLHIINSHFGTPDGAATFFLYVTLIFGWRAVKHDRDLDFVLFVASVGVSLAMKFYFPLLVPLAIVTWMQPRRMERLLLAAFVLAGSFSIASFFNYTPWELKELVRMLLHDNLDTEDGFGPLQQLGLYAWDSIRALGIGAWLCFLVGAADAMVRAWRAWVGSGSSISERVVGFVNSPYIVPASAFGVYLAAVLAADIHAPRHLLPFLPLMCFLAASGVTIIYKRIAPRRTLGAGILLLLFAYQSYNALGIEAQYRRDIRNVLANEIDKLPVPPEEVATFSEYSLVRGTRLTSPLEDARSEPESAYFVTCDLEYARYFSADTADKVFHARGGQTRLDFYRKLFAQQLDYRVAFEIHRQARTLEERLAASGFLSHIGEFLVNHCALFQRSSSSAHAAPIRNRAMRRPMREWS